MELVIAARMKSFDNHDTVCICHDLSRSQTRYLSLSLCAFFLAQGLACETAVSLTSRWIPDTYTNILSLNCRQRMYLGYEKENNQQ